MKEQPSVLLVDDSRDMLELLRRYMNGMGLTPFTTNNVVDAIEVLEQGPVDLVITDLNMPVMTGLEFLKQLREEPGGDAPRVVFCTVENDVERIREALASGADEYIMKPFDGDILVAKFAEVGLV